MTEYEISCTCCHVPGNCRAYANTGKAPIYWILELNSTLIPATATPPYNLCDVGDCSGLWGTYVLTRCTTIDPRVTNTSFYPCCWLWFRGNPTPDNPRGDSGGAVVNCVVGFALYIFGNTTRLTAIVNEEGWDTRYESQPSEPRHVLSAFCGPDANADLNSYLPFATTPFPADPYPYDWEQQVPMPFRTPTVDTPIQSGWTRCFTPAGSTIHVWPVF